jgi:hypothetical protein
MNCAKEFWFFMASIAGHNSSNELERGKGVVSQSGREQAYIILPSQLIQDLRQVFTALT